MMLKARVGNISKSMAERLLKLVEYKGTHIKMLNNK